MQQLDPKAVWLFFISFLFRGLLYLIVVAYIVFAGLFTATSAEADAPFSGLLKFYWLIIPVYIVFVYVWARLSYNYYRYELTDDGFRKELGIIWKKYVTIPYDRIQNVDIYRGVVARILGLSDLHIQTAGASAQYSRYGAWGLSAEGRLPGLSREVAEQLRDELVHRAKSSKNQGL